MNGDDTKTLEKRRMQLSIVGGLFGLLAVVYTGVSIFVNMRNDIEILNSQIDSEIWTLGKEIKAVEAIARDNKHQLIEIRASQGF